MVSTDWSRTTKRLVIVGLVIILLLLAFAHRNFQREEVIFRS